VFAAEWYDGHLFNGIAVGQVGIFTPGNAGQFNGNNVVIGTGSEVDNRALNFHAEGYVGIFNGQTNTNTVNGLGAYIGRSDGARAIGTVGQFYNSNNNTVEMGTGAVVNSGNSNTAIGRVGIFDGSYNNQMKNIWVSGEGDEPGYSAGSTGAYVAGGSNNTAIGDVGIFNTAGTRENGVQGNIVYASQGAVVIAGTGNRATGTVGSFTGNIYTEVPQSVAIQGQVQVFAGNVTQNTVQSSAGAIIEGGNNNTATGYVGMFTGSVNTSPWGGPVSSVTNNTVLPSTGAWIVSGDNNRAIGSVGVFNMTAGYSNGDSYMRMNQVQGMGAYIAGGNNNLAIGTVGQFNGGMAGNNKVTGTGVIIRR
jgi:hypothetical protein